MVRANRVNVPLLRRRILSWYQSCGRDLPWRNHNDPYVILVSEVMLQQTQAERVREKLPLFLRKFPSLETLAASNKAEVVRAWQGMGYNLRAVRLHQLARLVRGEGKGRIPSDPSSLRELPGIGRYSAHAIACFGFNKRLPVVDVNIRRVLSRLFWKSRNAGDVRPEELVWELALEILPRHAQSWNHALMDFGATVCTSSSPRCSSCVAGDLCLSGRQPWTVRRGYRRKGKPPEPSHEGIPRRLWRGRIVEVLRLADAPLSVMEIGKSIHLPQPAKHHRWLKEIIDGLEQDGLVDRLGGREKGMKVRLGRG